MLSTSASAYPDSKPHYAILDGLRGVASLVGMARGMRLEKMKSHDDQRRDAAQTVEDRIMGLRVGIGGSGS